MFSIVVFFGSTEAWKTDMQHFVAPSLYMGIVPGMMLLSQSMDYKRRL